MSKFIADKTAEALAANDRGDSQGLAHALIEAISENDAPFEQTVTDMTDSVTRQRG
uniref:Antitoxin n=1 Tax=Streptomyces sp. NBC_00180 TaxID=2903632 RepID=A0AAU1I133_9ACTN